MIYMYLIEEDSFYYDTPEEAAIGAIEYILNNLI